MSSPDFKKTHILVEGLAALTGVLKFFIGLPLILLNYSGYSYLALPYFLLYIWVISGAIIYAHIILWTLDKAKVFDVKTNSLLTLLIIIGYYSVF